MRHFGLSSREHLGGNDALGSLHGQHYAPLPANSISTPNDPPTSDDMEFGTWGAIGLGIGALFITIGAVWFAASLMLKP